MRCAKCETENRDGRKFCAKCGSPFVRRCPQCSASNEPGEDFCGECGGALPGNAYAASDKLPPAKAAAPEIRITQEQPDTSTSIDGERKTVTALFAAAVFVSLAFMYLHTKAELAPEEDQGVLFALTKAPQYANIDYMDGFSDQLDTAFRAFPETEATFGTYWDANLPHGFDTSGTVDLQRGAYSNDSIHSGAAILRAGYGAEKLPWKPHLEGEYDYATGNRHTNPLRVGTYDQQYPSNHNAFGLVDLFGFQNIKQDRVNLSFTPDRNFHLLFQGGSLHLASVQDGVYNGGGIRQFSAPAGGFAHDDLGSEFDASAKYIFHRSIVVQAGVGHFFPGSVATSSGHGAPLTLGYFQLTYRFRISK